MFETPDDDTTDGVRVRYGREREVIIAFRRQLKVRFSRRRKTNIRGEMKERREEGFVL